MLDRNTDNTDNTATFWSNRYRRDATQTLPAITNARLGDWVSVSWATPQQVDEIDPSFIVDANDQLSASLTVSHWNGTGWVPVTGQQVSFATTSNMPSKITFDAVSTTKLKLDMTSASPRDPVTGNLAISDLRIPGVT
jgi:beta-galactosidase